MKKQTSQQLATEEFLKAVRAHSPAPRLVSPLDAVETGTHNAPAHTELTLGCHETIPHEERMYRRPEKESVEVRS